MKSAPIAAISCVNSYQIDSLFVPKPLRRDRRRYGYGWGWAIGVRLEQGPHSMPGTPGELTWGGLANTYYLVDRRNRVVALAFTQYLGDDDPAADAVMRAALYGDTAR